MKLHPILLYTANEHSPSPKVGSLSEGLSLLDSGLNASHSQLVVSGPVCAHKIIEDSKDLLYMWVISIAIFQIRD